MVTFISLPSSIHIAVVLIVLTCEKRINAFQIFNQAIKPYCIKSKSSKACPNYIPVEVGSIRSDKLILNLDYTDLNLCLVESPYLPIKSIGQGLLARFYQRPIFNISFGFDQMKAPICNVTYEQRNPASKRKLHKLLYAIRNNYMMYWSIDDMPLRWCYPVIAGNKKFCTDGFPIGCHIDKQGKMTIGCYLLDLPITKDMYAIFNHLDIEISYASNYYTSKGATLLGAVVRPRSLVGHRHNSIYKISAMIIKDTNATSLIRWTYTYSLTFKRVKSIKITRRDFFTSYSPYSFRQYSSLFNTALIIIFLALMMVRMFYYSFGRSNTIIPSMRNTQIMLKHGWRAIRSDVFRPPKHPLLLSVLIGSGIQCLLATFYTLLMAWIGCISFSNTSELLSPAILSYITSAGTAGYISAVIFKTMDGKNYIMNIILTPALIPGVFLSLAYILNSISLSVFTSSTPPETFELLLAMWLLLLCPLSYIGSYFGFKREALQLPVKPSKISRQIPEHKIFRYPLMGVAVASGLIFFTITVPIFIFLDCLRTHHVNESYAYAMIYFTLTILLCIQVSVYLCHLYLCAENYHWWWRAFLVGGSVAAPILLYSCYFYLVRTSYSYDAYNLTYFIIYFGYCNILAIYVCLMIGSVTFIAAFIYVKFAYQYVDIDIVQV